MNWRSAFDERYAWAWLAGAMCISAGLILWFSRGATFTLDEIVWYLDSPHLDAEGLLQPHFGHLVVTTRFVYDFLFGIFGVSYLPNRLLAAASVLLVVGLLFVYASRRVGKAVALAPCIVLLFFGADILHVLVGNAFTVLIAISFGIGAFLALDRGDRRGDAVACLLLCMGVVTYTVALAFVVGAATRLILVDLNRWSRIWVAAIPAILYCSWWLWSHAAAVGPDSQVILSNLLLLPSWGFQSLGAISASLVGFNHTFVDSTANGFAQAGGALAVLAIVGLGFRFVRGGFDPDLFGSIGVLVALWLLWVVVASAGRPPESSRYLLPGAIVVLLVAADAAKGVPWSRRGLVVLYVVAAGGLAVNVAQLRDTGSMFRTRYAPEVRAGFAALDLAASRSVANPSVPALPEGQGLAIANGQSPLSLPFWIEEQNGRSPARLYAAAAGMYGHLGYSLPELRSADDVVRAQTDAMLVAALGLELATPPAGPLGDCRVFDAGSDGNAYATLPRGGATLETVEGASIEVQRFAEGWWIPVGDLPAASPATLRVPPDRARERWRVSASTPFLKVCALR